MMAVAAVALALGAPMPAPASARRLSVHGNQIRLPDGTPFHMRGFNLLYMLDSPFSRPREDTDTLMKTLLPGTNVVRLVILHWDDRPTEAGGQDNANDCSEVAIDELEMPELGDREQTISTRCIRQLDAVLRWTAAHGLWAIITARASFAAGEHDESGELGATVFTDVEVRSRFIKMWTVIARRYRTFDMVAGYEILSEPRVQPNEVTAEHVRGFYQEAVGAVQAVDRRTPCLVGAAPYYSRSNLEDALLPDHHNIMYMFNFFVPRSYVQHLNPVLRYPGPMPCCDVHDKDHRRCCPNENGDLTSLSCCTRSIPVNRTILESILMEPLRFGTKHDVPVL